MEILLFPLQPLNRVGNNSYNYNDGNINESRPYYYRLKLVDKAGSFPILMYILIRADLHVNDILLYPNPVQNQLKFQLLLDAIRYNVWINDITGKT